MEDLERRRQFLCQLSALMGSLGVVGCGGGGGASGAGTGGTAAAGSAAPAPVPTTAPTPNAPAPASPPTVPAPFPAPAPGPAPAPTGPSPALQTQAMDLAKMIVLDSWHESSRYERFQRLTVLSGATATIKFHGEDFAAGGAVRPLLATQYRLLVDGNAMATANLASGDVRGTFTLDLSGLAQGWHAFDVTGGTAETCPRWFMYVDKGQPRADANVPVASGSYDVAHRALPHHYTWVPNNLRPRAWPLTPRDCPVFSEALPYAQMFRENIIPTREGNINRLNRTSTGITSTFNKQAYFWSDLIRKQPTLALLDGPRGVGTLMMPTTILVTRQGGAYFSDPWRIGRVDPDGTVHTRVGWRHKDVASYYDGPQDLELVGDWSAIPPERRGFHEIWGMAWDMASLATNPAAPLIDGEHPHVTGPRMFVSDSQNNRVILLTFKPDNRDVPVVTEFLTGLQDPWDVAWADGVLYVSERKAHRIAAYDAKTGAFLRTVVSGQPLATVDVNRDTVRLADLATLRAEPCVAPEGLFYQDGWLYFASKAQGQVRRINLATGVREVVCEPTLDGNSKFMKIALSDGTFGPRGTVFSCTWSIGAFGMPEAHLPGTGQRWGYNSFEYISRGKGGKWDSLGYASAVGIGLGRLLCGSSEEGLVQISKALPSDPAPNYAMYRTGMNAFLARGHNLVHGHNGYGFHGLALPWGETAEIDYFLKWNGLSA